MPKLPLRVLFMHGLEGGPKGIKVQRLKRLVKEVVAPDMRPFLNRTSLSNPWILGIVGLLGIGLPTTLYSANRVYRGLGRSDPSVSCWRPAAVNLLLGLACCAVGIRYMKQRAVRYAVEQCIQLQREAIDKFKPDIVVASSFGGAMAVFCMTRAYYRGPAVLLAPAAQKVAEAAGMPRIDREEIEDCKCGIEVIKGNADIVVPMADTLGLFEGIPGCHVHRVDDIHDLNKYLQTDVLLHHLQEAIELNDEFSSEPGHEKKQE